MWVSLDKCALHVQFSVLKWEKPVNEAQVQQLQSDWLTTEIGGVIYVDCNVVVVRVQLLCLHVFALIILTFRTKLSLKYFVLPFFQHSCVIHLMKGCVDAPYQIFRYEWMMNCSYFITYNDILL